MTAYLCLAATVLATAGGQIAYKLYVERRSRLLLGVTIMCFVAVPFLSYGALRGVALDVVYMATSLTVVLVTGFSVALLGERLAPVQWLGSLLVVVGVIVYNL